MGTPPQIVGLRNVVPTSADVCLYKSQNPNYTSLWLLQYVDDLQLTGSDADIEAFMKTLKTKYELRDYGEPRSFIGMEILRDFDSHNYSKKKR